MYNNNQTQEQTKKDFGGTTKTQTTEYTYNLLNRMTGAEITASGEDTQTIENTYSAQGKRIRKVENGDVSKYYYTGDEVLFTTTGAAFMLTENVLDTEGSIIASKRFEYPFDDKYRGMNTLQPGFGDFLMV